MSGVQEISWSGMLVAFSLLAIPLAGFAYFGVGLGRSTLVAVGRMTLQLAAVAFYLEAIFRQNSVWLNLLWVLVMVGTGVGTTLSRSGLKGRRLILPLVLSALSSLLLVDAFFLGLVIRLPYLFDAQYFIPISGMVLGNAMNHNIVGLNAYVEGLSRQQNLYSFLLVNGKSPQLALRPFIVQAVRKALNPMIASTSVMGLISLPGMMTGQILGGSPPATAIRYQIIIMLAIFSGCSLNLMLSILLVNRRLFDRMDRMIPPSLRTDRPG